MQELVGLGIMIVFFIVAYKMAREVDKHNVWKFIATFAVTLVICYGALTAICAAIWALTWVGTYVGDAMEWLIRAVIWPLLYLLRK